jgi:uncharacterized protein (DUF58 family)
MVRSAASCPDMRRCHEILVRSVYPLGLVHGGKRAGDLMGAARASESRRVICRCQSARPRAGRSAAVWRDRAHGSGGDDFAGLREWRAGDSPRHIDWRALARGGPLMVKSWSMRARRASWCLTGSSLTLDEPARAAQIARWMEICESEGRPYELRLPEVTIRAGLGPAHLRRCLDALATAIHRGGRRRVGGAAGGKGGSDVSFEQPRICPQRPLLFLSLALLLAILAAAGLHRERGPGGVRLVPDLARRAAHERAACDGSRSPSSPPASRRCI